MSDWIMKVPVLSTAHISQATMQAITDEAGDLPTVVAPTPWGAFVSVGETNGNYPDLDALLVWAAETDEDYDWIRLDADGDEYDDLPKFDW